GRAEPRRSAAVLPGDAEPPDPHPAGDARPQIVAAKPCGAEDAREARDLGIEGREAVRHPGALVSGVDARATASSMDGPGSDGRKRGSDRAACRAFSR